MLKLLFLPGALFLLVILFRVVIPYISTAPWKRLIDSALYHRSRKEYDKSDMLLQKAVSKYPGQPEVYLDYFLNYGDEGNLKDRFEILMKGYQITADRVLAFFIGSTYLEHGLFTEAEKYLSTEESRKYMLETGITLLPELYYEKGDYARAEEEYVDFYSGLYKNDRNFSDTLKEMSPKDLITLALIRKASDGDYMSIMNLAPKTSVHSGMSWRDLLTSLQEKFKSLNPAVSGITGDPGDFNRKRRDYFQTRIKLIESYL